jgi:hypothetical protein
MNLAGCGFALRFLRREGKVQVQQEGEDVFLFFHAGGGAELVAAGYLQRHAFPSSPVFCCALSDKVQAQR